MFFVGDIIKHKQSKLEVTVSSVYNKFYIIEYKNGSFSSARKEIIDSNYTLANIEKVTLRYKII